MNLTFKFRDNDNAIELNIDNNSVLFGFNGTGKTRVLKLLQVLFDVRKNKNKFIDIFEQFNVEYINIDGKSFKSFLDEANITQENQIYNTFIIKNKPAFYDFEIKIKDIIENNKDIPFFPVSRFRLLLRREKDLLANSSFVDKGRQLRIFLNTAERLISEVSISFEKSEFYSRERKNQILLAERVISFLNRRFADFKFDNESYNSRNKIYNNSLYTENLFRNLNMEAKYISPDCEELNRIRDYIVQKLIEAKARIANQCANEIINQINKGYEETIEVKDKKLRTIFSNLKKVNEVLKKYTNISLKIEGNELVAEKNEDKLDLSLLSSGEMRLLALVLNAVFSTEHLLLVDEPEVSLSLNFQSKIMFDLITILDRKKIIIATHAPFVYKSCERMEFDLVEL